MGSFANSLFKTMLGWLQTAASAVWSAFTNENGNPLFTWIGRNWIWLAVFLCVAGLAADLIIYILRWRPYKVWKSFFSRGEDPDGEEDEMPEPRETGRRRRPAVNEQAYAVPVQHTPARTGQRPETYRPQRQHRPADPEQEPLQTSEAYDITDQDYPAMNGSDGPATAEPAYAEPEPARPVSGEPAAVPSAIRTGSAINAGYSVPDDSPYRRPAQAPAPETVPKTAPEKNDYSAGIKDRTAPVPVVPKRRRRINVSELFNDPEEELRQFDAPQNLIDSRKAYRDPVYPRGWKKSEDEGE